MNNETTKKTLVTHSLLLSQMSSPGTLSVCRTKGCKTKVRTTDHIHCPQHSLCAIQGVFNPNECPTCSRLLEVVRASEDPRSTTEWELLETQYPRAAASASRRGISEFGWSSPELAKWFGGPAGTASAPSPLMSENNLDTRHSPTSSKNLQTFQEENPQIAMLLKQLVGALGKMPENALDQAPSNSSKLIQQSRSRSPSPPPEKRCRLSSHNSMSPSQLQSPSSHQVAHSRPREISPSPMGTSTSTSAIPGGWFQVPSSWRHVTNADGSSTLLQPSFIDGREVWEEVLNIGAQERTSPLGDTQLWWRPRTSSTSTRLYVSQTCKESCTYNFFTQFPDSGGSFSHAIHYDDRFWI